MFLRLNHKNLEVYKSVRELTTEIYSISKRLPANEKINFIQQIRRAALSVKLNLAEGASRKSVNERKWHYLVSRGSVVEIDAIIETAADLKYFEVEELRNIGNLLNKCFAMLSNMIK
jgi:four helix bundle protein